MDFLVVDALISAVLNQIIGLTSHFWGILGIVSARGKQSKSSFGLAISHIKSANLNKNIESVWFESALKKNYSMKT